MLTDVSLLHITLDDGYTPAWPPVWREGVLQSWFWWQPVQCGVVLPCFYAKEGEPPPAANTPDSGLLIAAIMV